MLSLANPRHSHEVKVLKDIPIGSDQYIIAGVIDEGVRQGDLLVVGQILIAKNEHRILVHARVDS